MGKPLIFGVETMATITRKRVIEREDNEGEALNSGSTGLTPENWGKNLTVFADTLDDEPETSLDRLATMLTGSSSEDRAELKVYKSIEGKMAYCKSYTPSEFENGSFELIRRQCGTGEFELRLYGNNEAGKYCIRARQPLTIAKLAETELVSESGQNNQIAMMIDSLAKNQADLIRAISERPSQPDPMAQMSQMFTMMGLMREAMGISNAPQNQKSSIGEIVEAIKELKGAASIITPESEPEDSPMKMFGQITDLIKATKTEQPQRTRLLSNPAPVNQAVQEQPLPQPTQQTESTDMNVLQMIKLKGYLSALVTMAKDNKPPTDGADLIYEKLPDEMIEVLYLEQWFDVLSQFAPEAAPHKEWLTKARDAAMLLFDAPDESDTGVDGAVNPV